MRDSAERALPGLWTTNWDGNLFEILGAGLDCGGRQLAVGNRKPEKSAEELGMVDEDPGA